jgi:hypothetical protein
MNAAAQLTTNAPAVSPLLRRSINAVAIAAGVRSAMRGRAQQCVLAAVSKGFRLIPIYLRAVWNYLKMQFFLLHPAALMPIQECTHHR